MDLETILPLAMFAALALFLFSGYPVAFVLGGVGLAFGFLAILLDPDWYNITMFSAIPGRIFGGIAENLILTAIPMFIFMGTMLERSGVAKDLLYCLEVLLRRVPGGLAISVVLMGTIMAATTGIIGASVVMMTLLALPTMMKMGYDNRLATGSIAASGTLGILIPPSIMLVIMADLLGRSVGNLFFAAFFPGLLLAALYVVYVCGISAIFPKMAPSSDADFGPQNTSARIGMVLQSFLPPVFLIFLVLGSILLGWATPTEAAGVGAAGSVLLGFINLVVLPKLGINSLDERYGAIGGTDTVVVPRDSFFTVLKDVVVRAALTNAMIFGLFIGATMFSYVFRNLGGDDVVIGMVEHLGLGSWGLLFLIMGVVFVLGFFFDWLEITLIVLPVFSPIIERLDFGAHVDQFEMVYWFAILLAVNLQTSFLTPPFGFALFYMKAVAPPGVKIEHIYLGIIPFVILQLIGLGLVMAFPDIALWLPRTFLN
ncbi:MAG: TRAP transporter large permease subunit [Rhodospirillales bacterium]